MAEVKAPFNFIPAPDKVFYPGWADQVSHDVPFKDSLDGYIDITVKAETPIFVRNGNLDRDPEHKDITFSHIVEDGKKKYFIPGSTMKGTIRSVLEILSFGKMHIDPRMRFAQREWDNTAIYDKVQMCNPSKVHAGWLRKRSDGEGYFIEMAERFYRINQARLDEYFENDIFAGTFGDESGTGRLEDSHKTQMYKYSLVDEKALKGLYFDIDEEYSTERSDRVMVSSVGHIHGDIVLTGQPDKWSPRGAAERKKAKGRGKFYEFVFEYAKSAAQEFDISTEEYEQYKFIYGGTAVNDKDLLDQWNFIDDKVNAYGAPVFFRLNADGTLKDFGFTCLYKLPYTFTPDQFEQRREKAGRFDLAELIFGYIDEKKAEVDALKGRVQFSHLFSEDAHEDEKETRILAGPKASYYPIYVRQPDGRLVRSYKTYNDESASLAGWKRYVNRTDVWSKLTGSEKLDTSMVPLCKGTTFKGRMVYHNLKPEELGALLSALTFHGNAGCYHQIGQGKPYGFGRVSISIGNIPEDYKELMASFEIMMDQDVKDSWRKSRTIKEFFAMSSDIVEKDDEHFKYMELSLERNVNEFVDGKKEKKALPYYTDLRPDSVVTLNEDGVKSKVEGQAAEKILQDEAELYSSFEAALEKGEIESAKTALDALEYFCKSHAGTVSRTASDIESCRKSIETKQAEQKAKELEEKANAGQKKGVDEILAGVTEKTKLDTLKENLLKAVKRDGADLHPYKNQIIEKFGVIISAMKSGDLKKLKPEKYKDLAEAIGAEVTDLVKK